MEISKSIFLPTNSTQVFEAIAKGDLFRATGIVENSLEQDFQEAGEYSFAWHAHGQCQGVFKQIIPGRGLTMSWTKAEEETQVSISLRVLTKGTELKLVHKGFTENEAFESHNKGWDKVLKTFSEQVSPMHA